MIGKEILNYRISALIGKGGMGSVYLAEHKFITTQKVAIKVINKEMLNSFTVGLLKQEAEHLASLNHPNIVHFIDYHVDDEGNVYLVMEYAPGISLDKYIKTVTGLIVEDRIAPLFLPILDAVHYAHGKHILHRDIKPQNIIVGEDGTPKILDFGISQILHADGDDIEDSFAAGTPSFMSPEQVRNEKLDERSDVYSLGVMLHNMLSGTAPYDTSTLSANEIESRVVNEPLPPLRSFYKYISDRTQKVVDKATAKDRDKRYANCAEFKRALHKALYPAKMSLPMKIGIGAAATVLLGVAGFIWDYNREKVEYYAYYTEVNGIPQGITEVSKSDASNRYRTYRFTYKKHKLTSVALINAKGNLEDPNSSNETQHTLQQFFYDGNGNVDYVKILDRNSKVLYVMDYNTELTTATFRYDDSHGTERNLNANTSDVFGRNSSFDEGKSRISRYILTRDSEGRVIKTQYAGFQNQLVSDGDGIWGYETVYDEQGRIIEKHYLGYDGNIKGKKSGLAIEVRVWDDKNVVEEQYLTSTREAAGELYSKAPILRVKYDDYGNIIYQGYFSIDGKPINGEDSNVSTYIVEYNNGLRTLVKFLDTEGQPTKNVENASGWKYSYDDNGYQTEYTVIDVDGKPTISTHGYASVKMVNDPRGNRLSFAYFDENGANAFSPQDGYFKQTCTYDSLGNATVVSYFDVDDKPAMIPGGYHFVRMSYDKLNRIVTREWFDVDGKHSGGDSGIECTTLEYDVAGNIVKTTYLDGETKQPKPCNDGNCGFTSKFNELGLRTETTYFDKEGKPVRLSSGYAIVKREYDAQGNETLLRFYDASGAPCYSTYGSVRCAGYRAEYDERGNMLFYQNIEANGSPLKGYLTTKYKYDDKDNQIEYSYWTGDSKGTNSFNIHRCTQVFNERKLITEQRFYNTSGNPVTNTNEGAAVVRHKYDASGNETEVSYFNTSDKPTNNNKSYHKNVKEYNAMNKCVRELYYLASGELVSNKEMAPEITYKYDKWGNICERIYCDGKGNPVTHPGVKCSIFRAVYDCKNQLEGTYYDTKGNPVLNIANYHKEVYTYNKRHQLSVMALYDTAGKPIDSSLGFQRVLIYFDREHREAYRRYFSASGRVIYTEKMVDNEWKEYNGSIPADCTNDDSAPASTTVDGTPSAPEKKEDKPATPKAEVKTDDTPSVSASAVASIKRELPKYIESEGGTIKMTSITSRGNTVTVVFRTENSKYDTSDKEISAIKAKVRSELRKIKSRTNATKVTGSILDSKDRNIDTINI